jgi:hypothetical protein
MGRGVRLPFGVSLLGVPKERLQLGEGWGRHFLPVRIHRSPGSDGYDARQRSTFLKLGSRRHRCRNWCRSEKGIRSRSLSGVVYWYHRTVLMQLSVMRTPVALPPPTRQGSSAMQNLEELIERATRHVESGRRIVARQRGSWPATAREYPPIFSSAPSRFSRWTWSTCSRGIAGRGLNYAHLSPTAKHADGT